MRIQALAIVFLSILSLTATADDPKQKPIAKETPKLEYTGERFKILQDNNSVGSMVLDNKTGRIWERVAGTTKMDWAAAKSFCDNRTFGGRSDWRLPRIEELTSLVAKVPDQPLPLNHPFTVASDNYWSSTEMYADVGESIFFATGSPSSEQKTTKYFAWCVRAGAVTAYPGSNQRFTLNGEDVTDTKTSLTWKRKRTTNTNWYGARASCRQYGSDWRLATRKELHSLLAPKADESPLLPPGHPFTNTWPPYDVHRTWTLMSDSAVKAWTLRFSDADASERSRDEDNPGWCVKMDPAAQWPEGSQDRFLITSNVNVQDRETQLIWTRSPESTTVEYFDAAAACAAKSSGASGWRLPTLAEMQTLIDYKATSSPKFPAGHPFTNVTAGDYWTTTAHGSSDMKTLNPSDGTESRMASHGAKLLYWCLRPKT